MPDDFFIQPLSYPKPVRFTLGDLQVQHPQSNLCYFDRVCQALEPGGSAARRVIITWHLDSDEREFDDAVVIFVGDERHQIPSYTSRARHIFKTGGLRPNTLGQTLGLPLSISSRQLLRDLRNLGLSIRRRVQGIHCLSLYPKMDEIPLGYHKLVGTPWLGWTERENDVFFAGALSSTARFTIRPSVAARRQLRAAMETLIQERADLKIVCELGTRQAVRLDPPQYSRALMKSKIALCPRGNFDETFRLFEAAKSGCVIVSEPLPKRWYYRGLPVVEVRRWSELSKAVREVMNDPAAAEQRAAATKQWWDAMASETAVARFIHQQLQSS